MRIIFLWTLFEKFKFWEWFELHLPLFFEFLIKVLKILILTAWKCKANFKLIFIFSISAIEPLSLTPALNFDVINLQFDIRFMILQNMVESNVQILNTSVPRIFYDSIVSLHVVIHALFNEPLFNQAFFLATSTKPNFMVLKQREFDHLLFWAGHQIMRHLHHRRFWGDLRESPSLRERFGWRNLDSWLGRCS